MQSFIQYNGIGGRVVRPC